MTNISSITLDSEQLSRFIQLYGKTIKPYTKIRGYMNRDQFYIELVTDNGLYRYAFKDELNFNKAWAIICSQEHRVSDADYELYVAYNNNR